ncbi:MAG: aldolase/citrate lyase family protein [Candidatus Latescibacterota bacterium]
MKLVTDLRDHIAQGRVALGTFVVELRTPAVARILRQGGFDFMLVDTEHGCYDPATVAALIQAGKQAGICPLVRVPGPEQAEIKRVLDAGALGIMVPMCRTLEEVQQAVASSKYPPLGRRGAHFARPHTEFVAPADAAEFMGRANRSLLTIVQIETGEAAELVDSIAAMDGVDLLYVGPGDLSIALGHAGDITHPAVMAVVERTCRACAAHGKIAGCHFATPQVLPELRALGVRLVGYGAVIRMLRDGVERAGQAALRALGQTPA